MPFRSSRLALLLLPLAVTAPGLRAQYTAAPVAPLTASAAVPGRLVVIYRDPAVPASADTLARVAGAQVRAHLTHLGVSLLSVAPEQTVDTIAALARRPEVAAVLQDRLVAGHAMPVRTATPATLPARHNAPAPAPATVPSATAHVTTAPSANRSAALIFTTPTSRPDLTYNSPAGWAVRAAGGYGDNIPGGPSTGPWTTTLGAGVRIAILDSGIDPRHPDLAPNLAVNLSEIDQTALPSPCDDGGPVDQEGHGTWAASLTAGAVGTGTGDIVGVAPQATLLNIKVLQRMPAATGATLAAQCAAGQTGGLLSWVLQGIDDAVAQHANVISLSLGSLVDLSTGDGAGWKSSFDRVTYAAAQAGVVIVAAAGNDGLDLSSGTLIELPAQARDVLPVTASTNPACSENLAAGATCAPGPVTRPYYSNYGATLNAISAPGGSYPAGPDSPAGQEDNASGWIRGACASGLPNTPDDLPANGGSYGCFGLGHTAYVQAMGTSASAPLVAGAAALLHAAHPAWTAEQTIAALRSTASILPGMAEPQINLPAAIALP